MTGEIITEQIAAPALTTVFSDAVIPVDNVVLNTFDNANNNRLSSLLRFQNYPSELKAIKILRSCTSFPVIRETREAVAMSLRRKHIEFL